MPLPLPAPLLPSNTLLQGLPAPSAPLVPYAAFVLAQSRRTCALRSHTLNTPSRLRLAGWFQLSESGPSWVGLPEGTPSVVIRSVASTECHRAQHLFRWHRGRRRRRARSLPEFALLLALVLSPRRRPCRPGSTGLGATQLLDAVPEGAPPGVIQSDASRLPEGAPSRAVRHEARLSSGSLATGCHRARTCVTCSSYQESPGAKFCMHFLFCFRSPIVIRVALRVMHALFRAV